MRNHQRHIQQCEQCRSEVLGLGASVETGLYPVESTTSASQLVCSEKIQSIQHAEDVPLSPFSENTDPEKAFVAVESPKAPLLFKGTFGITGMTCSACVGTISNALEEFSWIRTVDVGLLTNSATIVFEGKEHVDEIIETIEDRGYDASLDELDEVKLKEKQKGRSDTWKAALSIDGMTCSSCVGNVTAVVQNHSFVKHVDVNLISNSAIVVFDGRDHLGEITQSIEDAGFDVVVNDIARSSVGEEVEDIERTVAIRVKGMYCHHCPSKVGSALSSAFGSDVRVETPLALGNELLKIKYLPRPPDLTIRNIMHTIGAADRNFELSIYHPPSLEDRAREMQRRERRHILLRLILAIAVAIPTFIIGIVLMSLVPKDNPSREYLMRPLWAGNISRAEWALFILATPVYFFAADVFHRRAFNEIKAMWRPGSRTPFLKRFYRFGSMNMLMSLGTSIAYFASIAEVGIASQRAKHSTMGKSAYYFDSVVFLTMFLLIGRFLEAYSKAKAGDAVTSLGKLRPTEAILVDSAFGNDHKVPLDLLDVGDVVRIPHGASPPFDGTIVEGQTSFDESSLTGESLPIPKAVGDTVFSGTVNKGGPVTVQLTSISGSSMLDQIINVVREGQTRRAPVERVADIITGHFVPFVVLIGIVTWIIWLSLGLSGTLPDHYRDSSAGGWPLWSLRFAIAVFVIACPCGIGLAAPTALFVGGGLAARHGILVKGGGEAFQEASSLDCIVFDKTGTLTQGGDPAVTDYEHLAGDNDSRLLGTAKKMEEGSGHPVAKSIVSFCTSRSAESVEVVGIDEIPGKGMKGRFKVGGNHSIAILGNESLMADHSVHIGPEATERLKSWMQQGKSVALLATNSTIDAQEPWILSAIFAISDPLRPEAGPTVQALQKHGVAVWMLSGDNPTTARAVGAQVGIPSDNIIAGVLPDQKAEKIEYLQRSLEKRNSSRSPFSSIRRNRQSTKAHATVAMVGDGINDAPALATADVGIAIGSGSDIAMSSAAFILVSSHLTSLITLIDLSRAVFRRVWFNFGWALIYNVVAMPVAAGVLYPVRTGSGGHVRLDPVWASLAMALSSVSVVSSSLLLRTKIPGVGFRAREPVDVAAGRDEEKCACVARN
ncbi:copper-transporting P-type ATPase [Lineolata rhizophorae]|uniref:Copper-transporting P-type ATPase n=1 Tax=Lineolata rhizophorae TaxID=578093 RepID=A0A6A6P7R3_9PEZI|nr:copper-transporting P-type ATPase [Lineolata rhizophorae]